MTARSGNVTKRLREKLLNDQERRAKREAKLSFASKLRVVDQLMAAGEPKVEELKRSKRL